MSHKKDDLDEFLRLIAELAGEVGAGFEKAAEKILPFTQAVEERVAKVVEEFKK